MLTANTAKLTLMILLSQFAGYGLFMASVVAIMIADYWLLTKGNVFVSHLYVSSPSSTIITHARVLT